MTSQCLLKKWQSSPKISSTWTGTCKNSKRRWKTSSLSRNKNDCIINNSATFWSATKKAADRDHRRQEIFLTCASLQVTAMPHWKINWSKWHSSTRTHLCTSPCGSRVRSGALRPSTRLSPRKTNATAARRTLRAKSYLLRTPLISSTQESSLLAPCSRVSLERKKRPSKRRRCDQSSRKMSSCTTPWKTTWLSI